MNPEEKFYDLITQAEESLKRQEELMRKKQEEEETFNKLIKELKTLQETHQPHQAPTLNISWKIMLGSILHKDMLLNHR